MPGELDLVLSSFDKSCTQMQLKMSHTLGSILAIPRFRGSVLGTELSIVQMPSYLPISL